MPSPLFALLVTVCAPSGRPRASNLIARLGINRCSAVPKNAETPAFAGASIMRLRGVEPPRPVRATRPSTLRVYQFRHSRLRAADDSRRERAATRGPMRIVRLRTLLESIRGGRYSAEHVFAYRIERR